jgi:hypothetical protein
MPSASTGYTTSLGPNSGDTDCRLGRGQGVLNPAFNQQPGMKRQEQEALAVSQASGQRQGE